MIFLKFCDDMSEVLRSVLVLAFRNAKHISDFGLPRP